MTVLRDQIGRSRKKSAPARGSLRNEVQLGRTVRSRIVSPCLSIGPFRHPEKSETLRQTSGLSPVISQSHEFPARPLRIPCTFPAPRTKIPCSFAHLHREFHRKALESFVFWRRFFAFGPKFPAHSLQAGNSRLRRVDPTASPTCRWPWKISPPPR